MSQRASPEQALARPVVTWLQQQGWKVYQEVTCRGDVADIVATRGPLLAVVECKQSFGAELLGQCTRWRGFANLIWAAYSRAGKTRATAAQMLFMRIVRDDGIGLLDVPRHDPEYYGVHESRQPQLRRQIAPNLREALREEQATGEFAEAGAIGAGGRYTPFNHTRRQLAMLVSNEPGIALRDAIGAIEHHYASTASARASLVHWIENGSVPGVRLEREGRAVRLYPEASNV